MPVLFMRKPSIDRALGKKLPDVHVTGLERWWISRGGGGSQPLGRQNYASADGESASQERLDLCCQFVLSSVRLFHATLRSECVENVRCGG